MANELRRQIREAAAAALGALATTGARVYENRLAELQDTDLPGLRIYTNGQDVEAQGIGNTLEHNLLELVVECCTKKLAAMDDELDAMIKEVRVAIAANQTIGGAKSVQLTRVDIEMEGEAEREVGVARMTFEVSYFSARGAPDVAS